MLHTAYQCIDQHTHPQEGITIYEYKHLPSGATITHFANEDPNCTFMIGFPTPPMGSTGNCHILEHCLLEGSKHFPIKSPFMEAIKSSLHTFLNAFTYPDCTMYPISSQHAKDFLHLSEIYLDAVFFPLVLENPAIFFQEGWRYEITEEDAPITYTGVVYNEMRGVFSSALAQIEQKIDEVLLEGSDYAKCSGGHPDYIPTLEYEEFCNYHRAYYQPARAQIYVYGDAPIDDLLDLCDRYLTEKQEELQQQNIACAPIEYAPLPTFRPLSAHHVPVHDAEFSVDANEDTNKKSYLSYNVRLHPMTNDLRNVYSALLLRLFTSDASPIRQYLIEHLECEDFDAFCNSLRMQTLHLIATYVHEEKKENLELWIQEAFKAWFSDPSARDFLHAQLMQLKFQLYRQQEGATRGVNLGVLFLMQRFYGFPAREVFSSYALLEEAEQSLEKGGFEDYVRTHLLQSEHRCILFHRPIPGLSLQKERAQHEKLTAYKASLSSQELQELIARNRMLHQRMSSPNTPEELRCLPRLTLDDLPRSLPKIKRVTKQLEGAQVVLHPQLSKIQYIDVFFPIAHIPMEQMALLAFACEAIGQLDTKNYTYGQLTLEEEAVCGGIYLTPRIYTNYADSTVRPCIVLHVEILEQNALPRVLSLIEEQLWNTQFSDLSRLRELLQSARVLFREDLLWSGTNYMKERALSHHFTDSRYHQEIHGLHYLAFLKHWSETEDLSLLQTQLEELYQQLFIDEPLIHLTGPLHLLDQTLPAVHALLLKHPQQKKESSLAHITPSPCKEGFTFSSEVQFIAKAFAVPSSFAEGPIRLLLNNYLSESYLYREIRAKGGAYGASFQMMRDGRTLCSSYRDPNIQSTLDVFSKIPAHLRAQSWSQEDWERLIIGCVSRLLPARSIKDQAMFDLLRLLQGVPENYAQDLLEALYELRPEAMSIAADMLEKGQQNFSIAILGGTPAIEKEKDLFDHIEAI